MEKHQLLELRMMDLDFILFSFYFLLSYIEKGQRKLKCDTVVAAFFDNVIVGTEDEEEHDELVVEVVKRLVENDLYVKPEKCKWKVREVEFLGVVIGPEGIKMEEKKMKNVLDWPTPKCIKDVQKFLGLVNYYRQFIQSFADIARVLHDMVKKDRK